MNPKPSFRNFILLIGSLLALLLAGGVATAQYSSPPDERAITKAFSPAGVKRVFLPLVMNNAQPGTLPVPPAAPSGAGVSNVTQGMVQVHWTDNSNNETGFRVEQNIAGVFTLVATVTTNVQSANISGLLPETGYTFRVYAYNAAGNSAYSNLGSITTIAAPPAAPSNLVANLICYDRVALSWSDNSTDEFGFRIEQQQAPPSFISAKFVPTNTTSTVITSGLGSNKVFTYRVHAENNGGDSGFSNYVSVTTPIWLFTPAPCAPSNLTATPLSSTSVQLNWTDNSDIESGFHVEQAPHGGAFSTVQTPGANTTSVTINGLSAATPYDFKVHALNTYGDSGYSNVVVVTTPSVGAPAAPSDLTANASSSTSVVLNWQDNSDNETGFVVEEKIGSGGFSPLSALPAGTTSLTRSSQSANTQYTYHVRAVNGPLNSSWSNEASVTTPSNAQPPTSLPAAPTNLTTEVTSTHTIQLWWDNPETNNDEGVEIEHSTDGVSFSTAGGYGSFAGPQQVGANDGPLDPVSIHYYRVRTYNAAGHSAWSNVAYDITWGTTTPAVPTGLVATQVSSSVIHLKYNHPMTNAEGFLYSYSTDNSHWSADFGGLRTLEVDITTLPAGQQYWFKVRAYNRYGNLSHFNCSTDPMHCSGYSSVATATTAGGGGNSTRFVNNSSYPVISLVIDGAEKFAAPNAIPVGGYYEVPSSLTPGTPHEVAWANGFWQGSSPFKMYQGGESFTPTSGTATYTINNRSIGRLLAQFAPPGQQAYWMGTVWQGTSMGSRGFCFRNDSDEPNAPSHWWFYRDGVYDGNSGYVNLVSYPKPGTFSITFSVYSGADFQGTLDESAGLADFFMHNGPSDWRWVDYYQKGACPAHP